MKKKKKEKKKKKKKPSKLKDAKMNKTHRAEDGYKFSEGVSQVTLLLT